MDRIWRDARSIGELGGAMAGWLEGHIAARPGVHGRPNDETDSLVPILARLNRRGYVTTMSQPGYRGAADDDQPWVQRACVEGWISADDPMLPRIIRAARAAGLVVTAYGAGRAVGPRKGLMTTRWGNEPRLRCGGWPRFVVRRRAAPCAGREVRRQLRREGVWLAVVDWEWGRDDVLWSVLDQAMGHAYNDQGMRTA